MGYLVRRGGCAFLMALILGPLPVSAQPSFKTARLSGRDYVAVSELAAFYELGRDQHSSDKRADYRSGNTQLIFQADGRSMVVNGVNHWLSAPVLLSRGRLYVAEVDALKDIEPVLRADRYRPKDPVRTIVLDPGHGGRDRGARSATGALEKTLTLDLAKRVEKHLSTGTYRVLLTRTSDRTFSLDDRVEFAQERNADLFVSLHFNSGPSSATGIETYCLPVRGTASTASSRVRSSDHARVSGNWYDAQNVWLAHCMQERLLRATGAADRGIRRARFYVLRNARCPAVLVEGGFLSNRAEEKKIVTADHRELLAKAIAEGIFKYLKHGG